MRAPHCCTGACCCSPVAPASATTPASPRWSRPSRSAPGAETKWLADATADATACAGGSRSCSRKPLGPTEAVQIALLNNPGLQASYAEVGIAEADLVQASRWRGPTFSFGRLRRGDETEIERGVFFDVLGLLTIPLSIRARARAACRRRRHRAAAEALRVALDTRKAWFQAVAAQETRQVHGAGEGGRRDERGAGAPDGRGREFPEADAGSRAGVLRGDYGAAGAGAGTTKPRRGSAWLA